MRERDPGGQAPEAGAKAGGIFHCLNKFRIQPQAGASQRNKRNRRWAIRSRGQHTRRRPGSLVHELLTVQDGNAQILLRQFKRNGSTDDAPADNYDIVCLHADILSAMRSSAAFSLWV